MKPLTEQVLDVVRDWAERDEDLKPDGYAGNTIVSMGSTCDECCDELEISIDLAVLAERIATAIRDGRITLPGRGRG